MRSMLVMFAVLILLCCYAQPAFAEKVSVKIGYFNEAVVKTKYKPMSDADKFKTEAEQKLRNEVTAGNKKLADAQGNGASPDELNRMAKELQILVNARQKELIAEYHARHAEASKAMLAAAATVAKRLGLDVVIDGASVYRGGELCVASGYDITEPFLAALNVSGSSTTPKGTLKSVPVQWGYFDRAAVIKALPELNIDTLTYNAASRLRQEVEEGNQLLAAAQKQGKSGAEVEKMARDLQLEIDAKQKAAIQLIEDQRNIVNQKLISKLTQREGGACDVTVNTIGVYYGDQIIVDKGTNLTQLACDGEPSAPAGTSQPTTTASSAPIASPSPVSSSASSSSTSSSTAPSIASFSATPSSTTSSTTTSATADTPIRDKWAVIVGISKFAEPRYNLKFAAKDALDFRTFLINEQQFKPDHIVTLVDEQATRANIMSAFGSKWLPNVAEPGDLVVIYLSTHGTPSSIDNGGRNYVVAYDTDANNLYATAVDMDELSRRIKEGVRSDRALIVLDTCFSGNSIAGGKSLNRTGNFDLKEFPVGNGHLIISSSGSNQASWESKHQKTAYSLTT